MNLELIILLQLISNLILMIGWTYAIIKGLKLEQKLDQQVRHNIELYKKSKLSRKRKRSKSILKKSNFI